MYNNYCNHYSTVIIRLFVLTFLDKKKKFMMLWWQPIMTVLNQFCFASREDSYRGNIGIILEYLIPQHVLITIPTDVISTPHYTE